MSDRAEDSDVFEIVDFTTASDWERFTSRLEEVIHEWKLTNVIPYEPPVKSEVNVGLLNETSEEVSFADFPFVATHYSLGQSTAPGQQPRQEPQARENAGSKGVTDDLPGVLLDVVNPVSDFPAKAHCLTRWYGLRSFVVLSPKSYAVTNPSRVNMLLSSVAMAINNAGCHVPIFVQVHEKWRRLYLGQFESSGLRTLFEMVHLKQIPAKYSHLSGLVELFKAKVNSSVYPHPRVHVVIRLTYVLSQWSAQAVDATASRRVGGADDGKGRCSGSATSAAGDMDVGADDDDLLHLPFGACEDPISELHLAATWPDVDDDIITESEVYSDLDPLEAPIWSVKVKMADDPQCLLSTYLAELSRACGSEESIEQALGHYVVTPNDGGSGTSANIGTALERLTEPKVVPINIDMSSALHKVVSSTASKLQKRGANTPIPEADLNRILQYLFPDAKGSNRMDTDTRAVGSESISRLSKDGEMYDPKDVFSQYKTAPVDSLLAKVAICVCVANYTFGGIQAVAHLWQEFVLEMRYRWENGLTVPGLELGSPNLRYSIMYQKLQMLNCCIERKVSREQAAAAATAPAATQRRLPSSSSSTGVVFGIGSGTDHSSPDLSRASCDRSTVGMSGDDDATLARAPSSSSSGDFFAAAERATSASAAAAPSSEITASRTSDGSHRGGGDPEGSENRASSVSLNAAVAARTVDAAADGVQTRSSAEAEESDGEEFFECEEEREGPLTEAPVSENNAPTDKIDEGAELASQKYEEPTAAVAVSEKRPACNGDAAATPSHVPADRAVAASQSSLACVASSEDRPSEAAAVLAATGEVAQPEGRLRRCGDLMLIGLPGEPLYIPVTQEPAPMTEDMLAEHAEVLTKLGTTTEGANLRARMQSASLLSDMESFKAANPGCLLEDFVRWYSPRDFIADATSEHGGSLSERMLVPGNMWTEVWNNARPVPARRQRRLFDDTKEAEKVLHYLAALKPGQVALHVLPLVVQAAILRLKKESVVTVAVQSTIEKLANKAGLLTRHADQTAALYTDVLRQIHATEISISRADSLRAKFPCGQPAATKGEVDAGWSSSTSASFVQQLLDQSEVTIVGGAKTPAGAAVTALFKAADDERQQRERSDAAHRQSHATAERYHQSREANVATKSKPSGVHYAERTTDEEQQRSLQHVFGLPAAKEYILRTVAPCPAPYSRPCPQRLYCTLLANEARLAGAFTRDTTFQ